MFRSTRWKIGEENVGEETTDWIYKYERQPTGWIDNVIKMAGRNWIAMTEKHQNWDETYNQHWMA